MASQALRIGTLDDDLTSIAGAVHNRLSLSHLMVWIDDRRRVFIGDPDANPLIPTRWIVGTFGEGHSLSFIEADLKAMAQERSSNAMLDSHPSSDEQYI